MTSVIVRGAGALGFAAATLVLAPGVQAQESTNRVAANTDWSVFVEAKECWGVSTPKETVNTKDGKAITTTPLGSSPVINQAVVDSAGGGISIFAGDGPHFAQRSRIGQQ